MKTILSKFEYDRGNILIEWQCPVCGRMDKLTADNECIPTRSFLVFCDHTERYSNHTWCDGNCNGCKLECDKNHSFKIIEKTPLNQLAERLKK